MSQNKKFNTLTRLTSFQSKLPSLPNETVAMTAAVSTDDNLANKPP